MRKKNLLFVPCVFLLAALTWASDTPTPTTAPPASPTAASPAPSPTAATSNVGTTNGSNAIPIQKTPVYQVTYLVPHAKLVDAPDQCLRALTVTIIWAASQWPDDPAPVAEAINKRCRGWAVAVEITGYKR